MTTVYHNPKCRRSRAGLEYVRSLDKVVEVRDYIREGITPDEVKNLILMMGVRPFDLVRTQEEFYKENLNEITPTDEEWFTILSENPRLIRRPIVVSNGKAILADPPEKADIILK